MIKILKNILILFIFWNVSVFSDMRVEITRGVDSSCPIAIIPFTYLNKYQSSLILDEDITSIITADLCNSGKFSTLPISHLPHQPSKVSDIIPMFWEKLGVNIIVLGTININYNDEYTISYQLIDSSSNPALVILENQYSVQKKWLRHVAHIISNEIFEKITGIPGIFCTRIAYISYIKNNKYPYELFISDYDGYNQISIYRSSEPLMSPTWSSDGKKIAYVTFDSGYSELVVRTLNTNMIQKIINFPRHNGAPAFSPDGQKLAFSSSKTGSLNLYVIDLISENIQQLTNNSNNNTEPSWFPDSKHLAYTSDQSGMPQIYKINIYDTNNIQRLSWLHANNQNPNVSTSGTFIIMINRHQGKQNIAKLDLLTGQEQILTNTFMDDTPSISPNDTMILYSSVMTHTSTSTLKLISIDGKFTAHLTGITENIRFPKWASHYPYHEICNNDY